MNHDKQLTIHINIERDDIEKFDRLYKSCRTRFIRNAIQLANNSKESFDKIFFKDLLCNNDNNIHL